MKKEEFKMYDEGLHVFSQKWTKARKDHECDYCGDKIVKGDEYYSVRALNPGTDKPDTERFCYICVSEMAEQDFDADVNMPFSDSIERKNND